MRAVLWTPRARKDLARLDGAMVRRVAAAVEAFASTGLGDIKPLQGKLAGKLRLRVSDQRVFLDCDADAIRVLRVVARSEAYR